MITKRTERQQALYDEYKGYKINELRELDDDLLRELISIPGNRKTKAYTVLGDNAAKVIRERHGTFDGYRRTFGIKHRL